MFDFWTPKFLIFDLNIGFYMKFPPWGRVLRSQLWNLGPKVRISKFPVVFLDFEVWVKDFKVFELRFGFVKNCIYFTSRNQTNLWGEL